MYEMSLQVQILWRNSNCISYHRKKISSIADGHWYLNLNQTTFTQQVSLHPYKVHLV